MSNNCKLYVGNLPWSIRDERLQEVFEAYGVVTDSKVMTDRETGRSRGFGFVTFENEEDAQAAVEALNEKEVDGRALKVNVAKPREER